MVVDLVACPPAQDLEPAWRALEAQASPSIFTSWTWIGVWRGRLEARRRPLLLRAREGAQVVGLAILVPSLCRRLKLLPSRALHLHATADRRHDDIAIEHNGLLVRRAGAADIEAAMLAHLGHPGHRWDQVRLPGLSVVPEPLGRPPRGLRVRQQPGDGHLVDLAGLRRSGGASLAWLSGNTRSQIRRSCRAYAALGPLRTSVATDAPQALEFLERLKGFHQRAWTARGAPGAFANPMFEQFHRRIIDQGFPRGEVQMLRVHAGDHDIGYLYNLVHRGRVSCYQSGFNYGLLERNHHPGLTAHALAIEHCRDLGLDTYDFLAGSDRYKRQLATDDYRMIEVSIHRDTPWLRLEEGWRALKRRLRAGSGPAPRPQDGSDGSEGDRA